MDKKGRLILTRRVGERVLIGENQEITITNMGINGMQVRLAIECDKDIPILREEIYWKEQDKKTTLETL